MELVQTLEFILQDQVWLFGLGNQTHLPWMKPSVIFCTAVIIAILVVILLALFSPVPSSSSKNHSRPLLALSLYIQQPQSIASSNMQNPAAAVQLGAFIFHRTLTEGPANTSRVIGKAQGFIIPMEGFAHSAFNVIYLSFESPDYSGSLSVQANHLSNKEKRQELVVVGGTGSFAFARGVAVLAETQLHDDADATYHVKLELRLPKPVPTIPG